MWSLSKKQTRKQYFEASTDHYLSDVAITQLLYLCLSEWSSVFSGVRDWYDMWCWTEMIAILSTGTTRLCGMFTPRRLCVERCSHIRGAQLIYTFTQLGLIESQDSQQPDEALKKKNETENGKVCYNQHLLLI